MTSPTEPQQSESGMSGMKAGMASVSRTLSPCGASLMLGRGSGVVRSGTNIANGMHGPGRTAGRTPGCALMRWAGKRFLSVADRPQPEKGKERKNRKKRKKGKRTAFSAPRRRSVKVFAEKITPVGCHFLRKTAQPPDLDRAAERG